MRNLQRKQWACGLGVKKDGRVSIANTSHLIGFAYVAGRITLRLDGHLMHALNDGALIGTWPAPWLARTCPHCMVPNRPPGKRPPPPLPLDPFRHNDACTTVAK